MDPAASIAASCSAPVGRSNTHNTLKSAVAIKLTAAMTRQKRAVVIMASSRGDPSTVPGDALTLGAAAARGHRPKGSDAVNFRLMCVSGHVVRLWP